MASVFGMEAGADGQPMDMKEVQGKLKVRFWVLTVLLKDDNAWFAPGICGILIVAMAS
jgi:hypothetical protein